LWSRFCAETGEGNVHIQLITFQIKNLQLDIHHEQKERSAANGRFDLGIQRLWRSRGRFVFCSSSPPVKLAAAAAHS
jgi:hypothetical protein